MGQRHKHADVIIEWAEGKDVQIWDDVAKRWWVVMNPSFYEDREYRIKPPNKKYRVALFNAGTEGYTLTADNQETSNDYEGMHDFVRWLTDWVEYEE